MAKAVKLADIAKPLGVSAVTVSKALSGKKGVSEEMRRKIVRLADELGYQPPSAAQKAEVKSYNIGVLIHEMYLSKYDTFYLKMYQCVATQALEEKSFTIMEVVNDQMEEKKELPKMLQENKVDGIIVVGRLNEAYLAQLNRSTEIPFVYLDFCNEQLKVDSIISDSYYGAYYLTNYLFAMGHTKIAYVGTLLATGSITDRYFGYAKSLMEHGVSLRDDWQIDDRHLDTGRVDDEQLFVLPEEMPTAFLCNCDPTAAKLIKKLQKLGYRVPDDISVTGYDNFLIPGACDVAITSYEVNIKEMARQAVQIMIRKLGKENFASSIYIIEGHMVIKESVKNLNAEEKR